MQELMQRAAKPRKRDASPPPVTASMPPKTFSARPTLTTLIFYVVVLSGSIYRVSNAKDSTRLRLTAASIAESPVLPASVLLGMRLASAALIWYSLLSRVFSKTGLVQEIMRFPTSRLRPSCVVMGGPLVLTTFTVQCWVVQGVFFSLSSAASAVHLGLLPPQALPEWAPRLIHLSLQIGFTVALLTSAVVTFVLIPSILRRGATPFAFFRTHQQLMHCANLYLMINELLYSSIPMLPADFLYIVIYALGYLGLAWLWCSRTHIVYYPFVDPTLPAVLAIPIYIGIVLVLFVFFLVGCGLQAANSAPAVRELVPWPLRSLLVYTVAYALVWTRRRGVPLPPDGSSFMPWAEAHAECVRMEKPTSEGWRYLEPPNAVPNAPLPS